MTDFISGASFLAALAIAVFFLRHWRASRDRLFFFLSLAFAVFAANRLLLALLEEEAEVYVYASRAAAFFLIIVAIVDKNRPGAGAPG